MHVPERYRLPAVAASSVLVALLVVAVVLVSGRATPSDQRTAPASTPPAGTPATSTPEGAVRAFFEAFARARRTDDPSVIRPFVTDERSDAFQSANGFLLGQRAEGKASVITQLELTNVSVARQGATARVSFDYVAGGYGIDWDTGPPLESRVDLLGHRVTATVHLRGDVWLVDSYVSR